MIYQLSLGSGIPYSGTGEVFYLPFPTDPYTLRLLVPATSPVAQEGTVYTNHPAKGQSFDREKFQEFPLQSDSLNTDLYVDIEIHQSGPYTIYTSYTTSEGTYGQLENKKTKTREWNFIVSPYMEINGKEVTPNCLTVQTVLAKLMGELGEWDKKLDTIAEKGYNMIHFVPLQPRGESDSPFSLYDQLGWDATTFPNGDKDVEELVAKLQKRGILALSDVVLNHTANNSEWLKEHPEVGYTAETSPHLLAAIELDSGILEYSKEIDGTEIHNWDDIQAVVRGVDEKVISERKLWEYYVMDCAQLERCVEQHPFEGRPPSNLPTDLPALAAELVGKAQIDFDTLGDRFSRRIDSSILAEYVAGSAYSAKQIVDEINLKLYREFDADRATILQELGNRMKYLRLDEHGPKLGKTISKASPIAEPYFTYVKTTGKGTVAMANNGWVWAADPMVDFAGPNSKAYLTRQVIIWGDCVKLRYGSGPSACPYLWDRMTKYTQLLAKYFSGLRIDNCHSTPAHVGAYLLDKARLVRPELYVVAELFSGSEDIDKMYVEKLGITSLLREAIQPDSVKDFSTQINVNGGLPIGSFIKDEVLEDQPTIQVKSSRIHAWLMECTHDNETFAQKRTVEDTLSTAGLVAMCQVASGCTMGNDECYPKALNIVSEERPYVFGGGISEAKAVLNKLHTEMGDMNAFESFTDHQGQYITVNRLNPETGNGYFLIARTAFYRDGEQALNEIFLEKTKVEWYKGWSISSGSERNDPKDKIEPVEIELQELNPLNFNFEDGSTKIYPPAAHDFPQGSVAIFKLSRSFDAEKIEKLVRIGQKDAVKELDLYSLGVLLYRCDIEERTATEGKFGVYDIPNYGRLVYAGLQGWESILRHVVACNDLGSPVCDNLREGEWAFYATVERLEYYHNKGYDFGKVIGWLRTRIDALKEIPSFLRPRYFAAVMLGLYDAAVEKAMSLMPSGIGEAQFMTRLALTSLQMVTDLPGASLVPGSQVPSMAAGLPHFSEGIMRCWGRDVFLSVGGLLHQTGRYESAKQHIIGFGSTLKHGLIPNLLDAGRNPRYNARDAVWFFVQCIQDYCNHTKSIDILNEKVKRRFPLDDRFVEWDSPEAFSHVSTVGELVIEVLARHAGGIQFREHNAGPQIDMHMKDNGFNQKIWVDWDTGIVFGGNQDNCGTWMDKMGESIQANSEGVPGTPRDGAAVEIIGLLKSCLRWVTELEDSGKYHFNQTSVKNQHGDEISLKHWNELLQKSFEKCFYVPVHAEDDEKHDIDSKLVNRRGIYKDLYKSGKPYEDYQLRPNFCIAVVAAPELFNTDHVLSALGTADEALCGPVGMATLDPSDWNYHPYYENSIDSTDFATAKGRNYHQGPEWVWCKGVFLQALVIVDRLRGVDKSETIGLIRARLQGDVTWLDDSPWAGLTELTQKAGALCGDSSPTQAWSSARMIEAITETLQ